MSAKAAEKAALTGPGGPFEVITAEVDGIEMLVYRDRLPHLRAVAELAAARGDERPFLVYGSQRIGFSEFFHRANRIADSLLHDFGIQSGDRVAVLSANNPEWCETFWATVNMGAILVGLNGWWKADEVLYGLQDSGSRVLIADRGRFERIAHDLDQLDALEAVFLIDADPADYDNHPKLHRFDELRRSSAGSPQSDSVGFPSNAIDEGDAAVIFYTSGTTGRPKGAISSHRNMIANLQNTIYNGVASAILSTDDPSTTVAPPQTAALLTSPLFHVSGCHSSLVVGTLGGIKLVIPEGRFEPAKALQLIADESITVWATVPTMVWRVCEFPDRHQFDTTSVTSVAFGGSPSADELQRMVRETFPNVRSTSNAYGLTESSSVATVINGQAAIEKPTSVGPPVPVVNIKIVDANGIEVATGDTGEVLIKGPIIMPGYWNKPEATAETVIDGWLHTGDIGRVDEEGFLFITDRAKDMIIRGGENIYCVEIEQRLVENPAIADAAVFGIPHKELGEEVKAVIQIAPGQEISEAQVKEWVAETLANFKVPTQVTLTNDKLPRNASGKLLKNVLRGQGEVSFAETM
ncbi:MAG: class I adenylate-forming enzyme family protein [Actinomycetes bacterium]